MAAEAIAAIKETMATINDTIETTSEGGKPWGI
jgi:hypothetical protein